MMAGSWTWTEVQGMSNVMRKSILYAIAHQKGLVIDWTTGQISRPKGEEG